MEENLPASVERTIALVKFLLRLRSIQMTLKLLIHLHFDRFLPTRLRNASLRLYEACCFISPLKKKGKKNLCRDLKTTADVTNDKIQLQWGEHEKVSKLLLLFL